MLTPIEAGAIVLAGVAAGTLNTIVGSGSLITFPTLLLAGYPPIVANVSNTVGLVPGGISGVIGYRVELVGQGHRLLRFGIVGSLGGISGGLLLLALPERTFERVVPFLILLACVLIALQPRLTAALARHSPEGHEDSPVLLGAIFLNGVYGGYFGAGQGVVLIALLAVFVRDGLQRLNALKNLVTVLVNGTAALLFVFFAPVAWLPALLIALGSVVGGQLGAIVGRRLPPAVLRGAIITVGTVVALRLLLPG